MPSQPQPAGDLMDSLGLVCYLDEGELVGGAILLLKVIGNDGSLRLSQCTTEGLSWLEQIGMLRQAEISASSACGYADLDD